MLIYTASAGNQGTLGGLVEVTHRFGRDPQVRPGARSGCVPAIPYAPITIPFTPEDDRMLHGAACHGCLLVSETSCEARNVSLDRALLVDTVGTVGAAFF